MKPVITIFALGFPLFFNQFSFAQPVFTLDSENALSKVLSQSYGHAWGDYDRDGHLDVFICNGQEANQLFKNNGNGTFTEIPDPGMLFSRPHATLPDIFLTTQSASWGDYNNDGYPDLAIVTSGQNILLFNDRNGGFTRNDNTPFTKTFQYTYSNSYSVSWVDIDKNGWLDAVEVSQNKPPIAYTSNYTDFYESDPSKIFAAAALPGNLTNKFMRSGTWSDFNEDGWQDLFIAVEQNVNYVFVNNNGTLELNSSLEPVITSGNHISNSWADYNNDGFMDLFVTTKSSSVPNLLYRNVNGQTFEKVDEAPFTIDMGDSRGSCWGDFDNDGWLDLYVANSGENFFYQNNGDGTFTKRTDPDTETIRVGGYSSSCSFVDYDQDGDLDLFLTDAYPSNSNSLFKNNGTSNNNWLSISLTGSRTLDNDGLLNATNQSAIGAKIYVKASINGKQVTQMREINGQSAFGAQSGLVSHFGLGNAAEAEELTIKWPSGIVQIYEKVPANQRLHFTEIQPPSTPPANLVATAVSSSQISLAWDHPSEPFAEGKYLISRCGTETGEYVVIGEVDVETASFADEGLNPGTIYYYKITAKNASGQLESNIASATTEEVLIQAPANLHATLATATAIHLAWEDKSDNETGFVIERSLSASAGFAVIDTAAADAETFVDENLNSGMSYWYRILAFNIDNQSAYSNEANATTLEYKPVILTLPSGIYQEPGTELIVPVRVENFKDILAAQFAVTWDPAVLEFVSAGDAALDGMDFHSPTPGGMNFLWDDLTGTAQSLPYNSILFNIRFQVIGNNGMSSVLDIPANPTGFVDLVIGDYFGLNLDVQVNPGSVHCQSLVTLAGRITNGAGDAVKGLAVVMSGDDNQSIISDDGTYSFQTRPDNSVEIALYKNNDVVKNNGITTLDIALIRRYILGIRPINDPYCLIAADVNRDGNVNINDVAQIRKVILSMQNSFGSQHEDSLLWKFVPKSFVFADPANPFPYEEKISIPMAAENQALDFVGIRLGDVNYSWDHSIARKRTGVGLGLYLSDVQLDGQEYISVPISVKNFENLSAFQFTIAWDADKLEFVQATSNPLQAYFGNHRMGEGFLTIAWDEPSGKSRTVADEQAIMELSFRVLKQESSEVRITSDLTLSVAYDDSLQEVEVISNNANIDVKGLNPANTGYNLQNYPNPFGDNGTNLKFNLIEEGDIRIIISNILGRPVTLIEGHYPAGTHEIRWQPANDLPNGIYIYQIEGKAGRSVKKISLSRQ